MNTKLNRLPSELFCEADEQGRLEMRRLVEATKNTSAYYIGRSIEGRNIEMYKIGKGRGRVAFFGAHHALEGITANILYTIIYILAGGLGSNFDGTDISLLNSLFTYYIIPCVNPDGVELRLHGPTCKYMIQRQCAMSGGDFHLWQANARGVDLNHNYDHRFSEYKLLEAEKGIVPGATLFSGEYPESEPECRATASLIRALAPDAVISLHTQGEEIYHSSDKVGCALAAFVSRYTGYRLSIPEGTASYGGLCDYTSTLGIPSLTIEVGRGHNPLPNAAIRPSLELLASPLLLLPTLLL